MADLVLIDTDVCIDTLTGRRPFSINSDEILLLAEKGEIQAFVSSVSFYNLFYLIAKWQSKKKAYYLLSKLRQIVSVAGISESEIDLSLASKWNDFEDALQYHAAKKFNCQAIITRNKQDFKTSTIPVYTPAEYLERIS